MVRWLIITAVVFGLVDVAAAAPLAPACSFEASTPVRIGGTAAGTGTMTCPGGIPGDQAMHVCLARQELVVNPFAAVPAFVDQNCANVEPEVGRTTFTVPVTRRCDRPHRRSPWITHMYMLGGAITDTAVSTPAYISC